MWTISGETLREMLSRKCFGTWQSNNPRSPAAARLGIAEVRFRVDVLDHPLYLMAVLLHDIQASVDAIELGRQGFALEEEQRDASKKAQYVVQRVLPYEL
jgi:hypothetical protein